MRAHGNFALCWLFAVVLFPLAIPGYAVTRVTCETPVSPHSEPTEYFVSLADAPSHIAHVSIRFPTFSGDTKLEMPVWNALYQVRNFSTHVEDVRAQGRSGQSATVLQTSTSEWDIQGRPGCAVTNYDIYLDVPGPLVVN